MCKSRGMIPLRPRPAFRRRQPRQSHHPALPARARRCADSTGWSLPTRTRITRRAHRCSSDAGGLDRSSLGAEIRTEFRRTSSCFEGRHGMGRLRFDMRIRVRRPMRRPRARRTPMGCVLKIPRRRELPCSRPISGPDGTRLIAREGGACAQWLRPASGIRTSLRRVRRRGRGADGMSGR